MPRPGQYPTSPESQFTVEQVFKNNGLILWWTQPSGQHYGENHEQGYDFDMPSRSKVGAISGGLVTYVGKGGYPDGQSTGYIIRIHSPDGTYLYLHNDMTLVKKGDAIQPGDPIALSGGCPTKINCGAVYSSCYCPIGCDCTSSGYHIEVRWKQAVDNGRDPWATGTWPNPLQHFHDVAATKVGNLSSDLVGQGTSPDFLSAISNTFGKIPNPWSLDTGVGETFANFDSVVTIYSPVDCPSHCLNIALLNIPIPDPVYFMQIVFEDIAAFILSGFLIILGIYFCFRVVNRTMDITGKVGTAFQAGSILAK